jgi:hypothetical protein
MSEVVGAVPTAWLDVGRDLAGLPRAVDSMVKALVTP